MTQQTPQVIVVHHHHYHSGSKSSGSSSHGKSNGSKQSLQRLTEAMYAKNQVNNKGVANKPKK